jgi:hypothetical protein
MTATTPLPRNYGTLFLMVANHQFLINVEFTLVDKSI